MQSFFTTNKWVVIWKLFKLFFSNLQITVGAVVCVEAEIRGEVKIGTKTIIHPCAKILATNGPIIIGDANIIEELATVENK